MDKLLVAFDGFILVVSKKFILEANRTPFYKGRMLLESLLWADTFLQVFLNRKTFFYYIGVLQNH